MTRTGRGYTNDWLRYSQARLARFPFCAVCGHLATVTDHIQSARAYPGLFWDESNHQSLCGPCNRRKAIAEEGALGRAHVKR
jgi:5-methylcytosine-specific restriction protein A